MRYLTTVLFVIITTNRLMSADQTVTAECIINKSLEACGGKKNIQRFASCHSVTEVCVYVDGRQVKTITESWCILPHRKRTSILHKDDNSVSEYVLDGEKGWYKESGRATEALNETEYNNMKAQLIACRAYLLYPLLEDKEIRFTVRPDRKIDGKDCYCILIQRKGWNEFTMAFSRQNYRPISICNEETEGGVKVLYETVGSDFREIDGYTCSFKGRLYRDSKLILELEVKKVTPLTKIDEKLFAKPE